MLYDDIIRQRQNEIFNEVQDMDEQILQMEVKLVKLKALKEQRVTEHRMLQEVKDRGLIDNEKKPTRVDFEDAVRRIFDHAGRPMAIGELIDRLEEFGYMWSNYQSAWYRIRNMKMIESTGARGYYNLIRIK